MGYIGAGISRFNTADELTVTGDATIDTTTLVVDSTNNNVGIGTASPEDFGGGYTTLEVAGSTTANGGIFKTATSDSAGTGTAGTEMLMYSNNGGGVIAVTSSDPLLFQTVGAERMRLTSAGLLGVNTTSPSAQVDVRTAALGTALQLSDNTNYGVNFIGVSGGLRMKMNGAQTLTIDQANNANVFHINGSGSVGIGTASPTASKLQVDGTDGAIARFRTTSGSNNTVINITSSDAAGTAGFSVGGNSSFPAMTFENGGSERMRIMSDGRIGKGRTSAIQGEDISHEYNSNNGAGLLMHSTDTSGNTHSQVIFRRNGSNVGSIQTSGSATSYNTSSDRRLKSNIEDAASASDKIDAIQVRQFDWNADDSHQDYGLIAQELQPIEPLAVSGDADSDEMMAVDYSKLVPMLIKEIQELRSRVAALEE
jgi:hypothetical protein